MSTTVCIAALSADCPQGATGTSGGRRYRTVGYGSGPFSAPGADHYRLPRVAMGADSDPRAALAGVAEPVGV